MGKGHRISIRGLRRLIPLAFVAGALTAPAAASAQVPALSVSDDSVVEHTGAEIWFDVTRAPAMGTTVAAYSTANGTAIRPDDWGTPVDNDSVPTDGLLTYTDGQSTIRVTVPIVNDSLVESDEDFFLNLGTINNGTAADPQGHAIIVNDDAAAPPCNVQCELAKQALTLIEFLNPAMPTILRQELAKIVSGQASVMSLSMLVTLFGSLKIQMTLKLLGTVLKKKAGASAGAPTFTVSTTTAFDQTGQKVVVLSIPKRARKLMGKAKKVKATLAATFTDTSGAAATGAISTQVKPKKKKK